MKDYRNLFFFLSHIGLSPLTVKNKQNTTFK